MLSGADSDRIAAAIAAAEARTSGEILCVLDTEPHVYRDWILAVAAILAFLLPFLATLVGLGPTRLLELLGLAGWLSPGESLSELRLVETYAAVQLLLFLLLALLLSRTPLAQRLAPLPLRRERVHQLALKQFLSQGIHLTEARTGVLIFVSLHDHMTEIIADEGIYTRVSPEVWGEADAALLAEAARGDLTAGFVRAIGMVGDILAEHFPPIQRNPDELPNRLIQL